jgi:hypothetical protein
MKKSIYLTIYLSIFLSFCLSISLNGQVINSQVIDEKTGIKRNAFYNLEEIKVRWKKAALENCPGVPCVTACSAGTASSTPTLTVITALTNITHTTTSATGISNAGISGANGLPPGVSASWASNTITISGTPSANGPFNYVIPLTGTSCISVNATGTITVRNPCGAGVPSTRPTLLVGSALTNITHTTTGASGISNAFISGANGLPPGVSASWASNTITISGTPSTTGTFNYTIPLTGTSCLDARGTIRVENP